MDQATRAAVRDAQRLASLRATGLLDSAPEEVFDRLTRLAARLLRVPIALFSLVDERRQFFKSAFGLGEPLASTRQTPLSHSFCKHVVAAQAPLVVDNAPSYPLVRNNLSISELGVMAYLGMPIRAPDGPVLGSLCVVDLRPHAWTPEDLAVLGDLAAAVEDELRARHEVATRRQAETELRAEREFVELTWDVLNALVVVVGEDGKILRASRPCARMAGRGPDELSGADFADSLIPQADRAGVRTGLVSLLRGETKRLTWQGRCVAADGAGRVLTWSASMMEEPARRNVLVTGLQRTERGRLD